MLQHLTKSNFTVFCKKNVGALTTTITKKEIVMTYEKDGVCVSVLVKITYLKIPMKDSVRMQVVQGQ